MKTKRKHKNMQKNYVGPSGSKNGRGENDLPTNWMEQGRASLKRYPEGMLRAVREGLAEHMAQDEEEAQALMLIGDYEEKL